MKVYVYPADETGCGYYRMIWPANVLRRDGHDVTVVRPQDRHSAFKGEVNTRGELVNVVIPEDADVIVLQRITHRHVVDSIKMLRERGVTVIVDMDDDLSAVNPSNPAFTMMHPKFGEHADHSWHNAQRACDYASHVTVSTESLLARYAAHGRGTVVHNYVPQRYLDVSHEDSTVIGWGGSVHSHPGDLDVVGAGVASVISDDVPFHVVGPVTGVQDALRLPSAPFATGPRHILTEWPLAVASLGIGIAPLTDTKFNASKSWLKPLEYSALGVPWVASPRAEYVRLHQLGVGLLAKKPRQWSSQLRQLVEDPKLRKTMSEAGRDVARTLTIEDNAWRYMGAWVVAHEQE